MPRNPDSGTGELLHVACRCPVDRPVPVRGGSRGSIPGAIDAQPASPGRHAGPGMSRLALAALLVAACGSAFALSSDRRQPMDIEAGRSDCGLGANASCTLSGNVIITQGSLRVTSARAVIQQSGGNPSRAVLSGSVSLQQDMDDGDRIQAVAANVDYDLRNEVMVLTGDVTINQKRGSLSGQRVVYNLKTGQVESGGEGGGRVRMRILPKAGDAAGGTDSP